MTRFARAQGSKSSNERVPHEATSWAEMKNQLASTNTEIDDSKKTAFLDLREKNYKKFLDENAAEQTNIWTDFDDKATSLSIVKDQKAKGKVEKKISNPVNDKRKLQHEELQENSVKSDDRESLKKSKIKSKKKKKIEDDTVDNMAEKNKSKIELPENGEQETNGKFTVVTKVKKIFDNEKEYLLYQKKLARRERQKEKIKLRKEILASSDNNRLSQLFKEKEEKRKQKRLNIVLAKKTARENLRDIAESTVMKNNEMLTKTQKRKLRKLKKTDLISEICTNDKANVLLDIVDDDTVTEEKSGRNVKVKHRSSDNNIVQISLKTQFELNEDEQYESGKKMRKKEPEFVVDDESLEIVPDINRNLKTKSSTDYNPSKAELESNNVTNVENYKIHDHHNTDEQQRKKTKKKKQNKLDQQQSNKCTKEHKQKNSNWTSEYHKKPVGPETTIIHLNGRSIEIVLYDGFPVKKADHERLTQLRKDMISKGVPRSEVQRAIQLERRRAEKALAREKKEVCFHCRKAGHKLTECPEALTQETEATGICFKCGSTEHTHFECKVIQQQQFKFATCFICREPGHIAKQCSQNARGIYPQGGCCKVCGDVTHLKKDCPQHQAQQEHNVIHADTIDEANLEALDLEKPEEVKINAIIKPVKKTRIVKF